MTSINMTSTGAGTRDTSPRAQKSDKLSPVVTLYLFCVVFTAYTYVGPLYMNTLRALLLVLVTPLAVRLFMGHFGRLILTDFMFIGYFGWTVIAWGVNAPQVMVQQSGSVGAEFVGGYLVGRAFIRSRASFIAMCKQLAFFTLFLLPFGLLESQTGNPLIAQTIAKLPSIQSVPDVNIPGRMGLNRVQNTFTHPIHYGLFCSVAFSLTFIALKNQLKTPVRWIFSILIGFGCFLALSSGALLALLLQVILIAWHQALRKLPWRWWALVGLMVLAYIAVDLLSNRTPLRVFLSYATFSSHTAYWRALIFEYGLQNVWDNPWFGLGLRDWVRPEFMIGDSVDNFWLLTAMRFGLPAALFMIIGYLYGLLKIMFHPIDKATNPELWHIRQAWVFTFVGLTFTLSTVHIWTSIYSFVFFAYAAGIWLLSAPQNEGDKAEAEADEAPRGANLPTSRFTRFAGQKPSGFARRDLGRSAGKSP